MEDIVVEDSESTIEKEEYSGLARRKKSKEDKRSLQVPHESVRVAICHTSATVRAGVEHILNADPNIEIVLTASSQDEIIAKADGLDIDVIQIDIDDIKTTELEFLHQLREKIPNAKIIIMVGCDDNEKIIGAIEMGIEGFLCKREAEADEIINVVHTVHEGGKAVAPCVTEALVGHMISNRDKAQVQLSSREQEVLDLIGVGKTNSDIAGSLLISVRTVKFHVSSILTKLGVKNRTQAALWLT